MIEQLALSQKNLVGKIDGTVENMGLASAKWRYLGLGFGMLALISSAFLGRQFSRKKAFQVDSQTPVEVNHDSDNTSQTERARFKTERNRLINDIRPLASGILYIKADENLETTGEIARYLNQSREAIARRIDALRKHALKIQHQLEHQPSEPSTASVKFNIDTTPIEELTFRANAELDGLQRRLKALHYTDKEEIRSLLVRCMRTERMLDEIRIRVKKGWLEELEQNSANQNEGTKNPGQSNQSQQAQLLVGEMLKYLNDFKLQPPKTKPKRKTESKAETTETAS